jgi:hypothetical protein
MTVFEQEQFVGDRSMNVEDYPDLMDNAGGLTRFSLRALAEYSVLGFNGKRSAKCVPLRMAGVLQ